MHFLPCYFLCFNFNFRNAAFLGYYTMALNSSNLGGSAHLNNLIGGALDVAAAALMMGLLKKFSRRNTLASLYALFAVISIAAPLVKSGKFTFSSQLNINLMFTSLDIKAEFCSRVVINRSFPRTVNQRLTVTQPEMWSLQKRCYC